MAEVLRSTASQFVPCTCTPISQRGSNKASCLTLLGVKRGQKGTWTSSAGSTLPNSRANTHSNLLKEQPCFNLHYLQSGHDLTHNLITQQPPNQKSLLPPNPMCRRQLSQKVHCCHSRRLTHILSLQVDHKTVPVNLQHWGNSNTHFKTASFSSKGQRNLHKINGGTCFSLLIVHFFKHSPGMLAPGPSCCHGLPHKAWERLKATG